MYKYIFYVVLSIAFLAGCNGKKSETASNANNEHNHASHDEYDPMGADHSDHDHASEEGHDHASEEGHDHSEAESESESESESSEESSEEIIFPKEQAALTDFKVEQVVTAPFSDVIKASGQLLPAQGDQICLSATVSGIVSFGGVRLTDGNRIKSGENIFYISSKSLASGDAAAKNNANYMKAKADFDRVETLLKDNIVSQKEYDAARYSYQQAKAEFDAVSSQQSDRGTAITAPMSGYLTGLEVHQGDYVQMGQLLASVSKNQRMELRAEVSQRYYPMLRSIRSATFRIPSGERVVQLDKMNGRLVSVGQAAASGGYMIPIIFEFDNPGDMVSGSYVEVYLLSSRRENVISLPLSAITEQQGVNYVYIQMDEEGYMRREVKLGASDGSRVAIETGLSVGEKVVTRGAIHVKMAASSGAIPHGHSH